MCDCSLFEMKSSPVPAVGSQSSEVTCRLLTKSTHFSACKCSCLSCLVSWLGNSAHHGEWPSCLLQKSVERQQASPCSLLPTTLHRQVLEQVTPEMCPIPSCGLSLTIQHNSSICKSNALLRNSTRSFLIYCSYPSSPFLGKAPRKEG